MKYLALLSGGKDSCYNLLHCHKNGHELIAAASLGPGPGKEELDSYLYQTVGQDAIELVASALDVPLYRRVITGSAVEQGSEYGTRTRIAAVEGDETEDLYALLSNVKSRHPDVQGVSVGAILSNYQRVRVEHVCRRLNLTPLCYLWQRNQGLLFTEMIEAGMEAIIIKIAGIGLTVNHLGKSLAQMQLTLFRLNELYGSHICGEGGEYETLVLDCPLFKHKIILEEVERVIHSDNDFATVAFLRIRKASIAQKSLSEVAFDVSAPPLLDESYSKIPPLLHGSPFPASQNVSPGSHDHVAHVHPSIMSRGSWITVTNIQRCDGSPFLLPEISLEDEVVECFGIMKELLSQHNLQLSNCVIVNIYLSSMDIFARVNVVYSTFFGTSPPARACIVVDLPVSINVRLDCLAFSERRPSDRYALHVQGLSYWAPANIGPYSQAIMADERVFVSGQIGLVPSSLSLPSPQSLELETALACQHASRICNSVSENTGGWKGYAQSIIYWLANIDDTSRVRKALIDHKSVQDEFASTIFIVVKALPKGALVEKQVLIHTGRTTEDDPDDDAICLKSHSFVFSEGRFPMQNGELYWQKSQVQDTSAACITICTRGGGEPVTNYMLILSLHAQTQDSESVSEFLRASKPCGSLFDQCINSRLFYSPNSQASWILRTIVDDLQCPTTFVPCRSISTFLDGDWDLALCLTTSQ
ncbi:hypothetical protein AX15_002983 [Amanita polypyramis BW_CC]|nr:hypothetical protein AX15_002983 [Amanita polypyramis BW_CC]